LASGDERLLTEVIRRAIWEKPEAHSFSSEFHSNKNMSRIGG
jgi:hypothetical protein